MLFQEPDGSRIASVVTEASECSMSAFSLLETSVVAMARKGAASAVLVDALINALQIRVEDFSAQQAEIARDAWDRFGKGRHPAALNIGDCCSYALASQLERPLLCKGEDFSKTDIRVVAY
jgi:ribonuclease VapC